MDANRGISTKRGAWRGGRALTRVSAVLCALALALGVSGVATAQETATPYGWHDGNEGVVTTAWQCSASGWAVDPDNRDRDLQIQILADGAPVATGVASQLREGLEDCPGGTCGFVIDLWGLISPGVEHLTMAQAYDEETSTWVDLPGTSKALTCWGYPEGFHDGAGGVVDPSACTAFGWAADPDDRDRDLQVQIFSDGSPLTTATANLWREDVTACPGGTCGFSVDLWGLIAPDVEHSVTAQAYDAESGLWLSLEATPKLLTCQSPPPAPSPGLRAFPDQDFVDGSNWPADQLVHLLIRGTEFTAWPDEYGSVGFYIGEFDLVRGDVLTMWSGELSIDYTVKMLFVMGFDLGAQTVSGTVNVETEGERVHVFVGQEAERYVDADISSGNWNWTADFSGNPILSPGVCGNAEAWGVGAGSTIVDWCVPMPPPSPFIWADPANDAVNGWDWPEGETLTFELFDPDGNLLHSESAVVEGGMAYDLRALGIDLQAGYRIVLSTDSFTKELVVSNLAITLYGETTETLQGVFDPAQGFWVNVGGQEPLATEMVDDRWTASFAEVSPGMCGEVAQPDPDGDMTGIGFCVPNPHFTVFPEWEAMELWEWPIGASIVLSIEDPGTAQSPDFENGYAVPPADWNPYESFLWIDIAGAYDVKPGDVVTITGAGFAVSHTVRYLTVDAVDPAQNTVSGTSDPGAGVYVWPHDLGHWSAGMYVDAVDGNWTADLGDLEYDLLPGTSGRAEIVDEFGNTTGIDWSAPRPRMNVYLEGEFVIGWDWPHGASLHLTIDDPATGAGADYEGDAVVEPAPFDPNTWWARFDFDGTYDVKPGDIVVLTDGTTVRTHVVYPLTVDAIDGEADTVAGTSDPGATVHVYPWGSYFGPTEADESGSWLMDFTEFYDLVPGTWGTAEVDDEAWNATAIDWMVPLRIDIRPWSASNVVLCRATWDLLPVAVFSEDGFDATAVDHDRVRFGRTGTEAGVVMVYGRPLRYARDVNGDGLLDMVYTFRFGDTGFSCADIPLGQHSARVEATLSGWMGDIYLEGRDSLTLFRLLGH